MHAPQIPILPTTQRAVPRCQRLACAALTCALWLAVGSSAHASRTPSPTLGLEKRVGELIPPLTLTAGLAFLVIDSAYAAQRRWLPRELVIVELLVPSLGFVITGAGEHAEGRELNRDLCYSASIAFALHAIINLAGDEIEQAESERTRRRSRVRIEHAGVVPRLDTRGATLLLTGRFE